MDDNDLLSSMYGVHLKFNVESSSQYISQVEEC